MPSDGAIIPVNRIDRTLEQQQRDVMDSLERRGGQIVSAGQNGSLFPRNWTSALDDWIQTRHARWNDEIERLRREAFSLLPYDSDLSSVTPFGHTDLFGHLPTIMTGMRQHMEAMERHINSIMQSAMNEFPRLETGGLTMIDNAYEPDEHGKPKFVIRFDLQGFNPDDLQVNAGNRKLSVRARKMERSANAASAREFYRMISLPDTIDEADITSRLTRDGILVIEAPVKPSEYKRIQFGSGREQTSAPLAILPTPTRSIGLPTIKDDTLKVLGRPGLTLLEDDRGGTKVHIETPIERGYMSTDMIVRVDPGEIVISGSKALKGPTGNNETRHVNEFSRAYRIPGRVDTEAIRTRGRRDVFVVEAPLVSWD